MRHFTCDLCGRDLSAASAERFVVKLEVIPAHAPAELTEADLDTDPVSAMADLLAELEDLGEFHAVPATTASHKAEYDLCPACRPKFVADPFNRDGRDGRRKLRFSKN